MLRTLLEANPSRQPFKDSDTICLRPVCMSVTGVAHFQWPCHGALQSTNRSVELFPNRDGLGLASLILNGPPKTGVFCKAVLFREAKYEIDSDFGCTTVVGQREKYLAERHAMPFSLQHLGGGILLKHLPARLRPPHGLLCSSFHRT